MDSMLRAEARVVAIRDDEAELALDVPAACGACRAQPVCGGSNERRLRLPHPGRLRPGDGVRIELPAQRLAAGAALAYLMPAMAMSAGALLLSPGGDLSAALGAFSGLGVAIVLLRLAARHGLVAVPRISRCPTVSTPLQGDAP